jgi:proline racemase
VVTPPVSAEADLGVLFLHNSGYSTMCGHGIIALVTALVETGAVPAAGEETPVAIDTPAGLVRATAHLDGEGRVERVSFRNVPSFLARRDVMVDVPDLGRVTLDIAFGGAFYAILPAGAIGLRVTVERLRPLVSAAAAIKEAVIAAGPIVHPTEEDLGFLYGVILTDRPEDPSHHSRNLCVFADSEVDRSPTGTGVSARLALHHAKGEIGESESIAIESILGAESVFEGRIVGLTQVGPHEAVVPEVSGKAFITGRHEFLMHPDDVLGRGFLM